MGIRSATKQGRGFRVGNGVFPCPIKDRGQLPGVYPFQGEGQPGDPPKEETGKPKERVNRWGDVIRKRATVRSSQWDPGAGRGMSGAVWEREPKGMAEAHDTE